MKRLKNILFRLFMIAFLAGLMIVGIDDYVNTLPLDHRKLAIVIVVALVLVFLVVKWWHEEKSPKKCKTVPAPAEVQKTAQVKKDYSAELAERAAPVVQDKPAPKVQKVEQEAKPYRWESIKFTIKGVTFEGRQRYLKKIDEVDDAWYDCTYEIQETEYKGEPAADIVACLMNGDEKVIGKVPAELVQRILELNELDPLVEVNVYGGDGKYYGASCKLSWKVYDE